MVDWVGGAGGYVVCSGANGAARGGWVYINGLGMGKCWVEGEG